MSALSTKIEWADYTANFWWGCDKVSEACRNCYAADMDQRFHGGAHWKGARKDQLASAEKKARRLARLCRERDFVQCMICGRREFRKWDDTLPPGGLACCSNPDCLSLPESDSMPARPRVFSLSMGDWLDPEVSVQWLARMLNVIRETPELDWLLLTKRPHCFDQRMNRVWIETIGSRKFPALAPWIGAWTRGDAPKNVWIGTTVETQKDADRRIPQLLEIPAWVRFLSCEPMLESVDFRNIEELMSSFKRSPHGWHNWLRQRIHWVICGGDSGPHARPMNPTWACSLRDQCQEAGVPFFFKQWGEWGRRGESGITCNDGDCRCWINDEPETGVCSHAEHSVRVGKKAAGRLLDGVEHSAVPHVEVSHA